MNIYEKYINIFIILMIGKNIFLSIITLHIYVTLNILIQFSTNDG